MFHYSKYADCLYDNIHDAVEEYLDAMPKEVFRDHYDNKRQIRIYKYDPLPLNKLSRDYLLGFVLEKMDEDYLPDCCDSTQVTPEMEMIADEFLWKIENIYPRRSFTLNPDSKFIDIDVVSWVNVNKPEWIKEK